MKYIKQMDKFIQKLKNENKIDGKNFFEDYEILKRIMKRRTIKRNNGYSRFREIENRIM